MSDISDLTLHIEGNKEDIKSLNSVMEELEKMENPLIENDFGNKWIGCLIERLGGDTSKTECRGRWYYRNIVDENHIFVNIELEELWYGKLGVFLKSKFPSLKIYWMLELEDGNITNDAELKYYGGIDNLEIFKDDLNK